MPKCGVYGFNWSNVWYTPSVLQVSTTGCGDFPNQVNNSVCFPGILKGTLLVRAEILEAALTKAIGQGRR